MPDSYAHYRFGTQVLALMPADVRGPILRHRALFDMGLHGPDFLFFHSLLKKTPLFALGHDCHQQSGIDFFTSACATARQMPGEAGFAYLHGLLAHYCLDSACHPLVCAMTDDTELGHTELETEFDRYLLQLDGHKKPHEHNTCHHIRLTKEECGIIAGFFPQICGKDVQLCIRNMALAHRLLSMPTPAGRVLVGTCTRFMGKNTAGKVMHAGPNPKCDHLNGKLLALYQQALRKFPVYLEQLNHHMVYGEPLGEEFRPNFDRG